MILGIIRPCGKESENFYQKLKRSLKDRHTKTHGNCIEIFRQAGPSLSIGREYIYLQNTTYLKYNLKLTKKVAIDRGIRYTCPLSTTLFNIYIGDIIHIVFPT